MFSKLNSTHLVILAFGLFMWAGLAAIAMAPEDEVPDGTLFISVFDGSDYNNLTGLQRDEIKREADEHFFVSAQPGDGLAFFALTKTSTDPVELLMEGVRPALPSTIQQMKEGSRDAEAKYEHELSELRAVYDLAWEKAKQPGTIGASPLVETMEVVQTWAANQGYDRVKILYLSDWLQLSPNGSAYEGGFENVVTSAPNPSSSVQIDVHAVYINRGDARKHQTPEHRAWAEKMVEIATGSEVVWSSI